MTFTLLNQNSQQLVCLTSTTRTVSNVTAFVNNWFFCLRQIRIRNLTVNHSSERQIETRRGRRGKQNRCIVVIIKETLQSSWLKSHYSKKHIWKVWDLSRASVMVMLSPGYGPLMIVIIQESLQRFIKKRKSQCVISAAHAGVKSKCLQSLSLQAQAWQ